MKKTLNIITMVLFLVLVVVSVVSMKTLFESTDLYNDLIGGYEVLYSYIGDVSLAKGEINKVLDEREIDKYILIEEDNTLRLSMRELTEYTGDIINEEIKGIEDDSFSLSEISINNYDEVNNNNSTLLVITLLVSFTLILLFMTFYYRTYGLISSFGLIVYVSLVLLLFNIMGGILTIPALGALIFGLGMAIDSSVIVFERIKEKFHEERDIDYATENAYKYSFMSIIDSNITTLVIGLVLLVFGSFYIRSFGFAMSISVVVSIFVMLLIQRVLFESISKFKFLKGYENILLGYNKKRKNTIPFMKYRKWFLRGSGIFIILGLIAMVLFRFNTSVDLNGGTEIYLTADMDSSYLVSELETLGFSEIEVRGNKIVMNYKINTTERFRIEDLFESEYQVNPRINTYEGLVKDSNTKLFIVTMLISFLAVFSYLWYRFDIKMAMYSIVALIHDVLIVTAIFSIFGLEMNILYLMSLLVIVGYSVNDTIVVFDRIRENMNRAKKEKKKIYPYNIVNKSISETMARTFATSFTTLIPVIIFIIFMGDGLLLFGISIILGILVGTYSSMMIASSLWLDNYK